MPTVESVANARAVSAATIEVAKPTGTVEGDLLVAVHVMDADSGIASMTAPGGWSLAGVKDPLAYICFVKIWLKTATGSEPANYTFGAGTSSETLITVLRISGADPDSPMDFAPVWADGGEVTGTSQAAPSGTATLAGSLLLAVWGALTEGADVSYTLPGGMTEHSDHPSPSDVWIKMATGSEPLAEAGATGTRTATSTLATRWLAGTLGIAPEPAAPVSAMARVHWAMVSTPVSPRVRIHYAQMAAAETVRVRLHHASLTASAGSQTSIRLSWATMTAPTAEGQVPPSGLRDLSGTWHAAAARELVDGQWL